MSQTLKRVDGFMTTVLQVSADVAWTLEITKLRLERFSLDCRIGICFGFGFGFTTSFGWLVYLLWFWFYDSQVKTALTE